MAEKTDPNSLSSLANKPITLPVAALLALLGPFVGGVGARQMDGRDAKIEALTAKVDAQALQLVETHADVVHLAETIGQVRRIEEAAHPPLGTVHNP